MGWRLAAGGWRKSARTSRDAAYFYVEVDLDLQLRFRTARRPPPAASP